MDLDWRDNEGRGAEDIARVSGSTRVVALIRFTIYHDGDLGGGGGVCGYVFEIENKGGEGSENGGSVGEGGGDRG